MTTENSNQQTQGAQLELEGKTQNKNKLTTVVRQKIK
jgi:hypothetical protein